MNRVARTFAFATAAGAVSLALAVPTAAVAEDLEHQDRGHQDGHVVREDPEARDDAPSGGGEDDDAAQEDDRAGDAQREPGDDEATREADGKEAEPEGVESQGTESDQGEDDQRGDGEDAEAPEQDDPADDPADDPSDDGAEEETAPTQRAEPTPRSEETQRPEPTEPGDRDDLSGRTARSEEPEEAPEVRNDTGATTTFADQRRATLTQLSRAEAYLAQARGRVDSAPIAPLFKHTMLAVLDERLRTVAGLIDHAEVVDTKAELGGVRRQALQQVAPQG